MVKSLNAKFTTFADIGVLKSKEWPPLPSQAIMVAKEEGLNVHLSQDKKDVEKILLEQITLLAPDLLILMGLTTPKFVNFSHSQSQFQVFQSA